MIRSTFEIGTEQHNTTRTKEITVKRMDINSILNLMANGDFTQGFQRAISNLRSRFRMEKVALPRHHERWLEVF